MFSEIAKRIADFLFPAFCVSCNKPGEWWCAECRSGVQIIQGEICPRCLSLIPPSSPFNKGKAVLSSRGTDHGVGEGVSCGDLPFVSVSAMGYYHDPKLRPIITALKFNGTQAVVSDLEKFIVSHPDRKNIIQVLESGCIVPMPLSDKRLRERGFNQAELIADALVHRASSIVHRPDRELGTMNGVLKRVDHRDAQSSLEHDLTKRKENIKDSFRCNPNPPKSVILVDDVVTTGATAAEAARVLLNAGAENVHLVCLAIGA